MLDMKALKKSTKKHVAIIVPVKAENEERKKKEGKMTTGKYEEVIGKARTIYVKRDRNNSTRQTTDAE